MQMKALCASVTLLLAVACQREGSPTKEEPENPRVLVIGVDGADWDILDPLIASGRMPTLATLMAKGSYGELETIEPILSPIIWTTIATGRRPNEHGITWFMERDAAGRTKPISSRLRQVPALWNIASDAGLRVGVYGWWATWPAETVSGYIVSDHVAAHGFGLTARNVDTDLGKTYPETLVDTIEPLRVRPSQIPDQEVREFMHIGEAELATRRGDAMDFRNPLHHFLYALAGHKTYENIGRTMLARNDTDLSLHYFEATDSLSHLFMKYTDPPLEGIPVELRSRFKDVVPKIYERQDRVLASLLEAAGPDVDVVIVSDHGFKTGEARLVENEHTAVDRAHEWHEKQGVIVLSGPSFRQGVRLNASIYDVTPTVLYALGLPVANTMPGRILSEAIDAERLARQPPTTVADYRSKTPPVARAEEAKTPDVAAAAGAQSAAEIDPDMLARLEALGYLDTTTTPEVLLNRARAALHEGKITEALATLEELLAAHPRFIDAEILLADLLAKSGRREESLARWQALAQREPSNRSVQRGLAQELFNVGQRERGLARARRAVDEGAEPLDWLLLSTLEQRMGNPAAALDAATQGLSRFEDNTRLMMHLGALLLESGDSNAAARVLDRVPDDARSREYWEHRARLATELGQPELAARYARRAANR